MLSFEYIQQGSKGDRVRQIQTYLNNWGFPLEAPKSLKVDGDFGYKTDNAVRQFQKHCGLKVDGIVGEKTYKILSNHSSVSLLIDTFNQEKVSQIMRRLILYQLTATSFNTEDADMSNVFSHLDIDKLMPLLIEDIKNDDPEIRCLAAECLQNIGYLDKSGYSEEVTNALDKLMSLLIVELSNDDPRIHCSSIEYLKKIEYLWTPQYTEDVNNALDKLIPLLIEELKNEDPEIRCLLAESLERIQYLWEAIYIEEVTNALVDALEQGDNCGAMISLLFNINPDKAVEMNLEPLLQAPWESIEESLKRWWEKHSKK